MRIVVFLRQALDPESIRVSSRGDLDTRQAVRVINPSDRCALEQALQIRDRQGGDVTVVSVGAPQLEDGLREALATGADRAILVSDAHLAACDDQAIAYVLMCSITNLQASGAAVDLVLTGDCSLDDGGADMAGFLGEELHWPSICCACQLEISSQALSATQVFEDGSQRVTVGLPAVASIADDANTPRLPHVAAIMGVYARRSLEVWGASDIGADPQRMAPLTTARRVFAPDVAPRLMLEGSAREAAAALVSHLQRRGLI